MLRSGSVMFLFVISVVLVLSVWLGLASGHRFSTLAEINDALTSGTSQNYQQAVILYQRLPRILIAIYVGATMACSGLVLQGLTQNPLATPSTLGVAAGTTLFVVIGAVYFRLTLEQQGFAALLGGLFGFACSVLISRMVSASSVAPGLMLILSGTLTGMLLFGIGNAVLLGNPTLRMDFLSWMTGNINHAYSDRLWAYCWMGICAVVVLQFMSGPLTLILLGREKALSVGVNAVMISRIALVLAIVAASSAVAICGPIGFVGLVVPHLVRPFAGQNFRVALPGCAVMGAIICVLADVGARTLFLPYVVHTGLIMSFLGGLFFIWVIRLHYVVPRMEQSS